MENGLSINTGLNSECTLLCCFDSETVFSNDNILSVHLILICRHKCRVDAISASHDLVRPSGIK
jgi:hypothetical protein